MNDAPERIWAASEWKRIDQGKWWDCNPGGDATEYTRADLCDPMQDERVKRMVDASARLEYVARQNTDDALEWERVCEDVRAARRDLEQP